MQLPSACWAVLAGNGKISRRFSFKVAPERWELTVPKQGLRKIRHGNLVEFVDGILVAIVVDDEWKGGLRRGGNTGAHACLPLATHHCDLALRCALPVFGFPLQAERRRSPILCNQNLVFRFCSYRSLEAHEAKKGGVQSTRESAGPRCNRNRAGREMEQRTWVGSSSWLPICPTSAMAPNQCVSG